MMVRSLRTIALLPLVVAGLAAPTSAVAQRAHYAYRPGDTVRFAQTMEIHGVSRGRGGTLALDVDRAAVVALAFLTSDSVRAWYDSLRLTITGPSGTRPAATAPALHAPFTLRIEPDGQTRTLHTPTLPDVVQQVTEFTPQFDDFLPLLPADLRASGSSRTDTVTSRSRSEGRTVTIRRIVRTHVERDTTVDGHAAAVLGIFSRIHVETTSPWGNEFSAALVLSGTESGIAIVSHTGGLLHRTRNGEVRGSTTYKGRGAEVAVPQTYTYRATTNRR